METVIDDLHIPPFLKFLLGNIKNIIQTQLITETHQIWRSHVLKLFVANGYARYLTGKTTCPSKLTHDIGSISESQLYKQWMLINQNLASTLYAIISPLILPYVLNLDTCLDI